MLLLTTSDYDCCRFFSSAHPAHISLWMTKDDPEKGKSHISSHSLPHLTPLTLLSHLVQHYQALILSLTYFFSIHISVPCKSCSNSNCRDKYTQIAHSTLSTGTNYLKPAIPWLWYLWRNYLSHNILQRFPFPRLHQIDMNKFLLCCWERKGRSLPKFNLLIKDFNSFFFLKVWGEGHWGKTVYLFKSHLKNFAWKHPA